LLSSKVIFGGRLLPWLLMLPQLAIVLVFFFLPAGQALMQSVMLEDAFGGSRQFVGLENFRRLLADPLYLGAFSTTAVFSLWVAVGAMFCGLLLALAAESALRGRTLYRSLMIWPYAVAPAVAGVLWLFLFAPASGILPRALATLGIDWNHLLDSDDAMTLIVIASVWKQIPYNFLFFVAGIQSIPRSLFEAAAIDGASALRRTLTITLPLLSPTIFFLLVINIVYAFFDTFAIVDATTQGGPGKATDILVYKVYHDGFKALDLGGSAAQSVILMTLVIALTALQFRFLDRKVHY
jgi:sn-glycerol 3-phosphate transport system permease protein